MVSLIPSDVEKSAMTSMVNIFFSNQTKIGRYIARILDPVAYPGIEKAQKCTITPVIYN